MFKPNFTITPAITKYLMDIEANRQVISSLPINTQVITSLMETARLASTHYSTQIEGNRLTQEQVFEVSQGGTFPNRERDEKEVKNYFLALDYVDELTKENQRNITEEQIQILHNLVYTGKKKISPYRDQQNVIRASQSGAIVYMPPEAHDVQPLMTDMASWINENLNSLELPVPIIAAIAHYQFATIHPYMDGNGRTARLLTNLILHKSGYGLKGIYSLEEYYAKNLQGYYQALTVGRSHNYYLGRAEADITQWIDYFSQTMAEAFSNVKAAAQKYSPQQDQTSLLRELDARQKRVLQLFKGSRFVTTKEIANFLQLTPRNTVNICNDWVDNGFLVKHGETNRSRKYELADKWLPLIQNG